VFVALVGERVFVAWKDVSGPRAFDPDKAAADVGAIHVFFGDELVAKHHANRFDGSAGVVFLGHAVDGNLGHLLAVHQVNDENLFVTSDAMGVDPEGLAPILEFTYHFQPHIFCLA